MFLSQPLIQLLIARGIQDIDEFLKPPSTGDFANPFFLANLEGAATQVLKAVRERARITIFGDCDCDGVLASHVLDSVLRRLGARVRIYLPHRDEGYGLSTQTGRVSLKEPDPTHIPSEIAAISAPFDRIWDSIGQQQSKVEKVLWQHPTRKLKK